MSTVTKVRVEETSNRRIARIAGVLFIIATATSLLSVPFLGPVNASNYLVSVSANGNQVLTGALLAFVAAVASAQYCNFAVSNTKEVQRRSGSWSRWFQAY